jgi:peroxiredoxin
MKSMLTMAALLACAAFSVSVKYELRRERSSLKNLVIGEPMPDFTLKDAAGAEVTLSAVVKQNKLVAINFWASWCGPCRLEMPGFEKTYQAKRHAGFVILGINEDEKREDMDKYLGARPVSFPLLLDSDGALMKRLGVRALPTTILVGADGRIVDVREGIHEYLSIFVDMHLEVPKTGR